MEENTTKSIYRNNCLIIFILIYLKIIDVFSTLWVIHKYSAREVNPLFSSMVYDAYAVIFTQVFMMSIVFFVLSYTNYSLIEQNSYEWLKVGNKLLKIIMYFYIIVVLSNISVLIRCVVE